MSKQLAQWVAMDNRLGKSCLCSIGTHNDLQLRERLDALHTAIRLQKITMLAWRGPRTPDQALIEAGMLVRADEAMRVEHALQHRAALRDAGPQWNDTEGPVRTTADEPTLRETALCLQPTGELLQRLGDLHMALRGRHVAPHDTGAAPDERLRACRARYKQQADAITRILRKRGIAMR